MREIKFRAWHGVDKKWLHGYRPGGEGCHLDGEVILTGNWLSECHGLMDINNVVFEQFTGLRDKNGKEIYEGDIVQTYLIAMKHKGPVLRIEYKEHRFAMVEDENDDGGCWYNIVEVIGNIHENPELLA